MKKLDLSNIVEGVRKLGAVKAVFEQMQEAMTEGFAAVLKGITAESSGVVAMFGMVDTGGGAPNYNISAGWAYYQGELYEVDAFAGAAGGGEVPVLTLVTTQKVEDPLVYSDGNTFDTLDVRKLAWSFAATGSGLADLDDVLTLSTLINTLIDVPGQINDVIDAAPGALDTLNELAAALGDDPNFAATVTSLLAAKAPLASPLLTGTPKINGQQIVHSLPDIGALTSYDSYTTPGIFHYVSTVGDPEYGVVIVWKPTDSTVRQLIITRIPTALTDGGIFERYYNGSTWSSIDKLSAGW